MNFNHSDLINQIDSRYLEMVKLIDHEIDSNYLLIGATARDFTFHNIYGFVLSERATEDVDFAVCVENWEQYSNLKTTLIENYSFVEVQEEMQS